MEVILLTIIANREQSGKFAYELPENVTQVYEVYLEDKEWLGSKGAGKSISLNKKENEALRALIMDEGGEEDYWPTLFALFQKRFSVDKFLMGAEFFRAAQDCYEKKYNQLTFADFLWTLRSIYLPLFLTMKTDVPKADLYHCVATGYSGILGSMGKIRHGGRLMISEHGIYTREREEEIIKAKWVANIYKNLWIEQFRKMSRLAYAQADIVTCLYAHARELQVELGCPEEKIYVTPNGINTQRLADIPGKQPGDEPFVSIGAVLRVTPIKDVKTMIQAFDFAKKRNPRLKLWIMGPWDEDEAYANECFELVKALGTADVEFTGRVDVRDYLGRMDMTILTSISEGQPLTILESYAAKKPVIATDVGNCRGLIYGEDDDFGEAGILTHIMNVKEIADAMVNLAANPALRKRMGENGYQRLMSKYTIEQMKDTYEQLYRQCAKDQGIAYPTEPFRLSEEQQT
jgi:glycosyltransferase involved in cell wall biosynthesis